MTAVSKRLIRGGLTAVAGRSAVALGVVLVNALVARLLSPEDTGLFLIALSIVTVAAVIADFGLGKTLLRVLPDAMLGGETGRAMSHIRRVMILGAASGLLAAGLLISPLGSQLAEALTHGPTLGSMMPLIALWLLVTLAINLLAETCRGFHHIGSAIFFGGALTGLGNILIVGSMLTLAWLTATSLQLGDVLGLFIVSGFVLMVLALIRLRARFRKWGEPATGSLGELFIMAWPFWLTNAALIMMVHAEIWILGFLRTPEEVAAFGLVARLAVLVSFPLLIVNSMLPPLISELHAAGETAKMQRMLRGAAGLTTLMSLVLFLVLLFFGEALSGLLFGSYYTGNWHIMMILAVGWLFHVWAGSGGFVLSMTDNQHTMMRITLAVVTITIVAGIWLTNRYGGMGMAIASTGGLVLQNVLMLLFIYKHIGIKIHAGVAGVQDVWREVTRRLNSLQGGSS